MAALGTVIRHANYGLELVDVLTGSGLVAESDVRAILQTPIAVPPTLYEPTSFVVNRSRWVFENLPDDIVFDVQAKHYLSRTLTSGTDVPAIPAGDVPGLLVEVGMVPKSGYPFPQALTRAVGLVRVGAAHDSATPIVIGAAITVTPLHTPIVPPDPPGPPVDGTLFHTFTAEDGQYAVWFLPDPGIVGAPPVALSYNVAATATVDLAGVPTDLSGALLDQPLITQTFNGAATLFLDTVVP